LDVNLAIWGIGEVKHNVVPFYMAQMVCMWKWLYVLKWIGPTSQQAPDYNKNQICITKFHGQSKLGSTPLVVHLELLDPNDP
jgi:hypothetical protein